MVNAIWMALRNVIPNILPFFSFHFPPNLSVSSIPVTLRAKANSPWLLTEKSTKPLSQANKYLVNQHRKQLPTANFSYFFLLVGRLYIIPCVIHLKRSWHMLKPFLSCHVLITRAYNRSRLISTMKKNYTGWKGSGVGLLVIT